MEMDVETVNVIEKNKQTNKLTTIFHGPLKDCRELNGLALCMISKGRWKFPSSHFQSTPEIPPSFLSYNRTREYLETLSSFLVI